MSARIIYLDIDGVLNGHEWCHMGHLNCPSLLPRPVSILNRIVAECDAAVVIHSSWRHKIASRGMTPRAVTWMLRSHGLVAEVVDVLAFEGEAAELRSRAILQHAQGDAWIAIDDLPLTVPRLIRPHPSIGLEPRHVSEARQLFGLKK